MVQSYNQQLAELKLPLDSSTATLPAQNSADAQAQKTEFNKSFNAMMQYAYRWIPAWKTLSDYIDQTRGIFNGDRTKIGQMIDHKVLLDSHATHCKRITASGMQTGMTDPARPWFKLTMDNFLLENVPGVREWLDEVTHRMLSVMNKSNIYKTFQNCYDELVEFGTGCFLILEDFDDVIRGRSLTCGEYFLRVNDKGRIDGFAREFEMTVGNLVKEFGKENCSGIVQGYFDQNRPDINIKVRHMIEANQTRIPGMEDYKNMPYRSAYWETGEGGTGFLAQRGYKRFPVIGPRWDAITTDMIYGYGPGWHAIGDIKELQVVHKDMLMAQEKLHNPPKVEDANVVGHSNTLPGGVTKSSSNAPNTGVRAAYQIDPRLDAFINSIESLHQKISKSMFSDLFLMISSMPVNSTTTAFEIATRKQEQMMMLGPILHNLNDEMHAPSIDLIYDIMLDAGLIPEPPQGIEGQEVRVQYISILAQAQRAMGVQDIERTLGFVVNASQVYPQAADNWDIDQAIQEVSDLNGSPAKLVVAKDKVAAIRQARADQQTQMMNMQASQMAADSASKLGKTPGSGSGSVLDNLGTAATQVLSGGARK